MEELEKKSAAGKELSAGPAEEDFSAQEVREEGALLDAGLIETPAESEDTGFVETPAETGYPGLIETPAEETRDVELLLEVQADEAGDLYAS
ncbi:MAG: hypothetical protein Q4B26_10320, partial [Eubacteriales bacterium]|nr:hypothetical protein [Eubacteriales bacterium]